MIDNVVAALSLPEKIDNWWEKAKQNGENTAVWERMKNSFEYFKTHGFPTIHLEDWKYTNVRKVIKHPYSWPVKDYSKLDRRVFDELPLTKGFDAYKLVFVNGYLEEELSELPEGENAFKVTHLEDVEAQGSYDDHLAAVVTNESGFTALNTALHTGGVLIDIPKGVVVDKPVFVYYVSLAEEDAYLIQPRNLVIAEDNSQVRLVEIFLSKGDQPTLTNIVTEISVGEGAYVDYSKLQLEEGESHHIGYTKIQQEKDSKVDTHQITINGAFIRNDLHFYLNNTGCNSVLNGLYVLDKKQFVDNHTRVDHAKPQCFSDELYKGILDDDSTAVFNGKVVVHQDAQQTNAYQRNTNVLLEDGATINTKPELEIYADDVKCTHGATSGYLDREAIFYLRSRGLSEHDARHLLLSSYSYEIIDKMPIDILKEPLKELIDEKLNKDK